MSVKLRAYVSEFIITLGPIMTTGKLYNVKAAGTDSFNKFKNLCPDCKTPTAVKQRLVCEDTLGLPQDQWHAHEGSEMLKGKELEDGTLIQVSPDELAAARASELPDNVLTITPHNREKVWNATWTADNAYVFVPKVVNEYYALMVELIRSGDLAYVGMCNLRNSEGLFRLDVWREMIVVQKLVWPEDCNEIDPVGGDCDQETVDQFRAVLTKKQIDFDTDKYRSSVKEQVVAMTEAIAGGAIAPKPAKSEKPKPGANLASALAALEAS